jgi:hypothetical protein
MTGILIGLVLAAIGVYALKLAWLYVIERRRPDWAAEREQFKKDLSTAAKVSKWIARYYWRW